MLDIFRFDTCTQSRRMIYLTIFLQVNYAQNKVVLTAQHVTGQPSTTSGGQTIPIHYLSGTIYAAQTFAVEKGGGYDISANFIAPTAKGTWPAFWLTATTGKRVLRAKVEIPWYCIMND